MCVQKHSLTCFFLSYIFVSSFGGHFSMISKDQFERKKNDVLDPEP